MTQLQDASQLNAQREREARRKEARQSVAQGDLSGISDINPDLFGELLQAAPFLFECLTLVPPEAQPEYTQDEALECTCGSRWPLDLDRDAAQAKLQRALADGAARRRLLMYEFLLFLRDVLKWYPQVAAPYVEACTRRGDAHLAVVLDGGIRSGGADTVSARSPS